MKGRGGSKGEGVKGGRGLNGEGVKRVGVERRGGEKREGGFQRPPGDPPETPRGGFEQVRFYPL